MPSAAPLTKITIPSRTASSTQGGVAMKVNLVVNGKRETVDADPAMPLLYALRDDLGLNNPKFGCGRAQCGACTVHVNGVPTRSCVTPLGSAADKSITTLNGL